MQEFVRSAPDALALQRPFLYRFALSKLRKGDIAEEVVQETLLAALEGRAKFRGDAALRTWLAAILKHKISDWHRREARNPARIGSAQYGRVEPEHDDMIDPLFDSAGNWITPPSDWPDPEQSLANKELREILDRCLATLTPAAARVLYLREIQGLTVREICTELGISESNCSVMLHRARLRARQYLEEHWFHRDGKRAQGSEPARQADVTPVPG